MHAVVSYASSPFLCANSFKSSQVFVIDITWNNSDRFEIYRRYSDFFSFQVIIVSVKVLQKQLIILILIQGPDLACMKYTFMAEVKGCATAAVSLGCMLLCLMLCALNGAFSAPSHSMHEACMD